MGIYQFGQLWIGGERVDDIRSISFSEEPAPSTSTIYAATSISVSATIKSCDWSSLIARLPTTKASPVVRIRLPLAALTSHVPMPRRTRSNRRIYGAHPSLGSRYWTTDGKMDRRRVRSRIAALCRGKTVALDGKLGAVEFDGVRHEPWGER
jgi:hypothetical protein